MLLLNAQGLSNGKHYVEISGIADGDFKSEIIDSEVFIEGSLRVYNDRIILNGKAWTSAKLVCDLSLEEYRERIEAEVNINIIKGMKEEYRTEKDENIIYVGEEEKNANITEIVVQELLVKVPMKKVAPQYKDKDIEEIYPEIKEIKKEGLSPFDILKNLKHN
ncbi:MAG: YceD family protein [Candidatus Kapaibacterium sp.]